jgi:phosphoenolpyruvate synthase/pyruvate phosphate dikinase
VVILDLDQASADTAGGKAAGLARLQELDLPVPPTVVLPVGAELEDAGEVVRRIGEPIAVRSSALGEDARDRSAAGQYETVLGVRKEELLSAIEHVRESTERAHAYGAGAEIAIVLQKQIAVTKAGVVFSRDPVSGDDVMIVECAFGSGDAVVSGVVTPDRYRIADRNVHARVTGPLRTLRIDELVYLLDHVRRAERGLGHPVDVEFCFERRTLWLLQCRPITTI